MGSLVNILHALACLLLLLIFALGSCRLGGYHFARPVIQYHNLFLCHCDDLTWVIHTDAVHALACLKLLLLDPLRLGACHCRRYFQKRMSTVFRWLGDPTDRPRRLRCHVAHSVCPSSQSSTANWTSTLPTSLTPCRTQTNIQMMLLELQETQAWVAGKLRVRIAWLC